MVKNTIQASNIDKDTFNSIKALRKGKAITKVKDFKKIKVGTHIFCLYPKKDSSIYKKGFYFGLCYIFQMGNNDIKLLKLYGYEVPVHIDFTKNIPISDINIQGCSFNVISNDCYDMINKIVLANEIIRSNGKKVIE